MAQTSRVVRPNDARAKKMRRDQREPADGRFAAARPRQSGLLERTPDDPMHLPSREALPQLTLPVLRSLRTHAEGVLSQSLGTADYVPEGRLKIAQRFIAGIRIAERTSFVP